MQNVHGSFIYLPNKYFLGKHLLQHCCILGPELRLRLKCHANLKEENEVIERCPWSSDSHKRKRTSHKWWLEDSWLPHSLTPNLSLFLHTLLILSWENAADSILTLGNTVYLSSFCFVSMKTFFLLLTVTPASLVLVFLLDCLQSNNLAKEMH